MGPTKKVAVAKGKTSKLSKIYLLIRDSQLEGAYATLDEAKDDSQAWDTIFEATKKIDVVSTFDYITRSIGSEVTE